jgi:hypothetical protein
VLVQSSISHSAGCKIRWLLYIVFYGSFITAVALEMVIVDELPFNSWMRWAHAFAFIYTGATATWLAGRALGRIGPASWEQREIDAAVARVRSRLEQA